MVINHHKIDIYIPDLIKKYLYKLKNMILLLFFAIKQSL